MHFSCALIYLNYSFVRWNAKKYNKTQRAHHFFGKVLSYAGVEITGRSLRDERMRIAFICIRTREIVNERSRTQSRGDAHPPGRNNVTRLPVRHWHVHAPNGLEPARVVLQPPLYFFSFWLIANCEKDPARRAFMPTLGLKDANGIGVFILLTFILLMSIVILKPTSSIN